MSKDRKTAQVVTRVTAQDREWLSQEAADNGLDVSSFIRMTLRRAKAANEQARSQVAA